MINDAATKEKVDSREQVRPVENGLKFRFKCLAHLYVGRRSPGCEIGKSVHSTLFDISQLLYYNNCRKYTNRLLLEKPYPASNNERAEIATSERPGLQRLRWFV